jgi:quinol-cytochrome oxidoreductase complex cytochrome b subunit
VSRLIRQLHRWLSIAFTVGVLANTIVIFMLGKGQQPPFWMYLLALIPLFLLLFSGLYLFVLPYVASRGRAKA